MKPQQSFIDRFSSEQITILLAMAMIVAALLAIAGMEFMFAAPEGERSNFAEAIHIIYREPQPEASE